MKVWRPLSVLVLALGSLAASAFAQDACIEVPGIGCYYAAEGLRNPDKPDLLIYFRGHILVNAHQNDKDWNRDWDTQFKDVKSNPGRIPSNLLLASAQQAFSYYGLKDVADSANMIVLVTGSSHIAVQPAVLKGLANQLNVAQFGTVHLASHSGGYVGLDASKLQPDAGAGPLETADGFGGVLLLDTFYDPAGLASMLKTYQKVGAICGGYYTPHNAARAAAFKRSCELKAFDSDAQHEKQVRPILKSFLLSTYGAKDAGSGSSHAPLNIDGNFVPKIGSLNF
jgi:hypothetical protein